MSLSAGSRLGPYEIRSPLGAGGMGEVYRAHDPRMGRDVAIKTSAERFSDRFEREVHAVAALNHPHICHIYDVGPNYLVMELVDGITLADRITQGAVPLDDALRIARQIADALEAAHDKGIIHRDLKPANIKLTSDGSVKVLDFGLAKMVEPAFTSTPDESPTVAMGRTIAGEIMGTAAYMAPEQARGRTVDKRADIWAFGVVLYEMLTGRRLYDGETISDTLAAVLTKEPDWNRVPAKVRRLLQRCLEKDPKKRLRDIGDAWQQLEDVPIPAPPRVVLPWVLAGVSAIIAAIVGIAWWNSASPRVEAPQPVRIDLDLGSDVVLASIAGPSFALSRDGTQLVFVSQGADGLRRLFTRRLDQFKATPLPGSEGANAPFFSPDGQWVGFFAKGKLKKARIDGGDTRDVCDATWGRGGTWGDDGRIIAALNTLTGLVVVSSDGGIPTPLTTLGPGEYTHRWPQLLPGGKAVLFSVSEAATNFDEADVVVFSLDDHRRETVLKRAGMYPRYVPGGQLLYVTKGSLYTVSFDPGRLEKHGAPERLLEVSSNAAIGFAQFDFDRNGTLAYRMGGSVDLMTLDWLDDAGNTQSLLADPGIYGFPRLSPDGNRLAVTETRSGNTDLWVHEWQPGRRTRLTQSVDVSTGAVTLTGIANPVWSPDGGVVVFRAGGRMFWKPRDGSGTPQPLADSNSKSPFQLPLSFAPDGTLVFSQQSPDGRAELRTWQMETQTGQLRPVGDSRLFIKTSTADAQAAFSPDGHWLAYADATDGDYQVYVRPFPDVEPRAPVSSAGGMVPRWSEKGQRLFYRTEDQRIMAVNYSVVGKSFTVDTPRAWSTRQLAATGTAWNYDVTRDGKRLVVMLPTGSPEPRAMQSHVTVIVNFLDEVQRQLAQQKK